MLLNLNALNLKNMLNVLKAQASTEVSVNRFLQNNLFSDLRKEGEKSNVIYINKSNEKKIVS